MVGGVALPAGWGHDIDDELGVVYVHLDSELGVQQDPEHGDWVVAFDEQVAGPFASPREAINWVEREYAENPRHALEW